MWYYIPDFGICAIVLITYLRRSLASLRVYLGDYESEWFAMMADMGFFVRTDERYQMAIPAGLTLEKVKNAALKLAKTQDDEENLHPEYLVANMPLSEAEARQKFLRQMDQDQRCADRDRLLAEIPPECKPQRRRPQLSAQRPNARRVHQNAKRHKARA